MLVIGEVPKNEKSVCRDGNMQGKNGEDSQAGQLLTLFNFFEGNVHKKDSVYNYHGRSRQWQKTHVWVFFWKLCVKEFETYIR